MNIAIKNNQIELSSRTESTVIKDIMQYCKIKHYHIINEDIILPYEQRTFIDGNGHRTYFDTESKTFKTSKHFWNNSPTTYKPKIIVLDYKPSFNKLNTLLGMLDSYNHLSKFNFIPFNKLIENIGATLMTKHIKIGFTVTAEQYKEYENILDDFLNSLEEIFIYDTVVKEYDEEEQ